MMHSVANVGECALVSSLTNSGAWRAIGRMAAIAICCLSLAACIGTSSKVARPNASAIGSKLWYTIENPGGMTPEGMAVLRTRLDERFVAVRAAESTPNAVHVKVTVTAYRMRHGAARALVGIMAGKDAVLSTVQVLDPATGQELGRLNVESGNATAVGSAGGLLRGHADEIADFVLAGGAPATVGDTPATAPPPPEEMKWRPRPVR
ncbi:DUF4410 domain-containing protein [Pseudoxanthomonas sp. LjRoot125]|uniref:DUF4410 domain-containing protein n=1 Tax=Pseudoxanthomonas sp. LjRoot125 TaxID=3342258 RepID=UPI003E11BC9C